MNKLNPLNTIADTLALFPDKRILRINLLWALIANICFANLLNAIGSYAGLELNAWFTIGSIYIFLITVTFILVDFWTAILSAALLLTTSLFFQIFLEANLQQFVILNAIILAIAYILIPLTSYIWRDRIVTGVLEIDFAEFYLATFFLLPTMLWQFVILVSIQSGWRPSLSKSLHDVKHSRHFITENHKWHNWANTSESVVKKIFRPETVEELVSIVKDANQQGEKIRVVGSSYSWPNLGKTSDSLVYCGALRHVEMDMSNPNQARIIAESGASNRQINEVLEEHGFALPSNVVLEVVRIGGLVSTGSHGSGLGNPVISDYIHAIDIIDSAGHIRHFEVGQDSDDIMDAVRLSLGMFGIIWKVTLNVQPTWNVRLYDFQCTFDDMLANIREWVTTYDAVDIFYFPYCDKVWIRRQERVDDKDYKARPRHSAGSLVLASVQMEFLRIIHWLMQHFPKLTPFLGRLMFKMAPRYDTIVPIVDWVHHRRSVDSVRLGNIEIAFSLDDEFNNFSTAWKSFVDITETYAQDGKYPFNMAFNARFLGKSNALLSPANVAQGHTCWIEVLSAINTPDWEAYTGELAEAWLQLPDAAPHWAKQWEHIPNIDAHLKARYGEQLQKFMDIRQELNVDPNNMFINELCDRLKMLSTSNELAD